jgi:L-threonylcarbamoyladenylate synthase
MTRLIIRDEAADLSEAVKALAQGVVVAYPTDTLYGLAADPRNPEAVARLFALKGRPADKATPLIAAGFDRALELMELTPVGHRLASSFWPGPLTLVGRARPGLAHAVLAEDGTVAIRVPRHVLARRLALEAGGAITSTSANVSGSPSTVDPDEVAAALPGLAVLVDAGPAPGGPPSTIVDVTGTVPQLVRPGAVPWERVLESLRSASTNAP